MCGTQSLSYKGYSSSLQQVIINRCEELARFAMMHCLSSSLCFWVWTILRETMDSLAHYDHHEHQEQPDDPLDYDADYPLPPSGSPSTLPVAALAAQTGGPVALPLTTYHKRKIPKYDLLSK